MQVIERIEGHYETQDVELGRVYTWSPEGVVVECDCRERRMIPGGFAIACDGCGADHAAVLSYSIRRPDTP